MTRGANVIRVLLGFVGVALLLGGLGLGVTYPSAWIGAAWMIINGSVLIIIVVIEVSRYGGGETTLPDARFQRTDEVFVDPTSNRRMRVFMDPASGERRYVAES